VYFQLSLNPRRCQRRSVLLNNQQRVLPGPNGSSPQHQEQPIRCGKGGSHVAAENDERLSQEGVCCHEFGRAVFQGLSASPLGERWWSVLCSL
jgi:hypothetical protein